MAGWGALCVLEAPLPGLGPGLGCRGGGKRQHTHTHGRARREVVFRDAAGRSRLRSPRGCACCAVCLRCRVPVSRGASIASLLFRRSSCSTAARRRHHAWDTRCQGGPRPENGLLYPSLASRALGTHRCCPRDCMSIVGNVVDPKELFWWLVGSKIDETDIAGKFTEVADENDSEEAQTKWLITVKMNVLVLYIDINELGFLYTWAPRLVFPITIVGCLARYSNEDVGCWSMIIDFSLTRV
ncbi:hypothetical protein MRX96_048570 [Rhipicephalus microplus]